MKQTGKYVIIVAGGRGVRMGADKPKQFLALAGKPILLRTVEHFVEWDPTATVIISLPADCMQMWKDVCDGFGVNFRHILARGGITRFHSVRNALEHVSPGALAAVHDGVRPIVATAMVDALFEKASECGAAIPVIPVTDSLRELSEDGSTAVDRSRFVAVQTPQVFRTDILLKAYSQPFSPLFTDDASVVEAAGYRISLCEGRRENVKITVPEDIPVAELFL